MPPDLMSWLLVFAAGLVLGGLNFWGLHLTVKKAVLSSSPIRLFLWSLLARMALLLPALVLLARWNPFYLLLCLLGFVVARKIVLYVTREAPHAP